jgi:hypothetical protein
MDQSLDAAIAHITQAVDCLASVRVAGAAREAEKRAAIRSAEAALRQTLADLCEGMSVQPANLPARRLLIEQVMIDSRASGPLDLDVSDDGVDLPGGAAAVGDHGDVTIAR